MKKYRYILLIAIPLVLFITWTILVKTVDVVYIDQLGYLGFYSLNNKINHYVVSRNTDLFKVLSDILLYLSFASVVPFAVMGVVQLVKRKSLKKVDHFIYVALAGYVLVVLSYFIFEIVEINASPLSKPGNVKMSYPSSHVFITIVLLFIALLGVFHYSDERSNSPIIALGAFGAISAASLISRMFSGRHYFTDIVGALLLAAFLTCLIYVLVDTLAPKKERKAD